MSNDSIVKSKETELFEHLRQEALRIEEDALFSAKAHFASAPLWRWMHILLGLPAAIGAGIAGVSAFKDQTMIAGAISIGVAALTSISTFLNPGDRASAHTAAGNSYLSLRNQARIFRTIELLSTDSAESVKPRLLKISERRDDLNSSSPLIPNWAYRKAKKRIEAGEAEYAVDQDKSN